MNMENMYKMRNAHKEMKNAEGTLHPVTGEKMELGEHDRSLADIFQDKKEQDTFLNRFIYNKDPDMGKDIAESLAAGTHLTPEQDKFLEKMRGAYNLRRAEIEKVQELLTPEEIQRVADTDPRIQEIVGKIGAEKAAELLGREFGDLGMSDEKNFKKMVKNMRHIQEIRTSDLAAQLDKDVQGALRSHNISEEKYFEATKSGLTSDTQENLRKLVAEDFGWFRKTIDFVGGGKLSMKGARQVYTNFEEQMAFLKECDKHLKVVGKVLQGTLTPEVRMAMQKYLLEGGDIGEKKEKNDVLTVQDYRQLKENADPDPAVLKSRWDTYKTAELGRRGIKDITKQPVAAEEIKNAFANKELRQRQSKAGGVLAALITLLFSSVAGQSKDDIKSSLTF